MDINAVASVAVASGSGASGTGASLQQATSNATINVAAQAGQAPAVRNGPSTLGGRLMTEIASSNRLGGVEKVGLIKTVAIIDRMDTNESLRTKMLKDVQAVTSFLERRAVAQSSNLPQIQTLQQVERVQQTAQQIVQRVQRQEIPQQNLPQVAEQSLNEVARGAGITVAQAVQAQRSEPQDIVEVRVPQNGERAPVPIEQPAPAEPVEVAEAEVEIDVPQLPLPGAGGGERAQVAVQEVQVVLPGQGGEEIEVPLPGIGSGNAEVAAVEFNVPGSNANAVEEAPVIGDVAPANIDRLV